MDRTLVNSNPIVELVVGLGVKMRFKGVLEELIPMTRQYFVLEGVQMFDLYSEFLFCVVFSVDDVITNLPHFKPMIPYCADDLD